MTSKNQIFISYSRQDTFFVEFFVKELKNRTKEKSSSLTDIQIWIDTQEIIGGENWVRKVDDAIKQSFVLYLIISPDALNSPYVNYEWAFALGVGVPVVPIIHRSFDRPAKLVNAVFFDFSNYHKQGAFFDWNSFIGDLFKHKKNSDMDIWNDPSYESVTLELLRKPNKYRTVMSAIDWVGKHRFEEAIPEIHKHLQDDEFPEKQILCMEVLKSFRNPKSIPHIMPFIYHPNWEIRNEAHNTLVAFGTEVIPPLLEIIKDDSLPERNGKPVSKINAISIIMSIFGSRSDDNRHLDLPDGNTIDVYNFLFKDSWLQGEVLKESFISLPSGTMHDFLFDRNKAYVDEYSQSRLESYFLKYDSSHFYDKEKEIGSVALLAALYLVTRKIVLGREPYPQPIKTLLLEAGFVLKET